MSAMRDIPWGDPLVEFRSDADVERRFRDATGRAAGPVLGFLDAPWLVDTLIVLSARLLTRVHLDRELTDLVGLVVSQDNSCRYCFAAQRAVLRILGYPEKRIVRLEQDLMIGDLGAPEKAALEYARKLSRSNPLPGPDDIARLRTSGFTDPAIRELVSLAALHTFFNRLATISALRPDGFEALPDAWYMRAFRPAMALVVGRYYRRESPAAPGGFEPGPYGFVVEALDGLTIAHELRGVFDGMWRSEILTRRCKAFLIGVVARALGCPRSEGEALRILAEEGLTGADALHVLDHLAWSEFTPQEAILVPFARETVWYQAPRLQERSRDVRGALSGGEFAEVVGVVSLANMICRMGAALAEVPASP